MMSDGLYDSPSVFQLVSLCVHVHVCALKCICVHVYGACVCVHVED